jgi:hypothetical protein
MHMAIRPTSRRWLTDSVRRLCTVADGRLTVQAITVAGSTGTDASAGTDTEVDTSSRRYL